MCQLQSTFECVKIALVLIVATTRFPISNSITTIIFQVGTLQAMMMINDDKVKLISLVFDFEMLISCDDYLKYPIYLLHLIGTNCRSYRSVETACLCAKRNRSFRSAALHVSSGDHKSSSVGGATKSGPGLLSRRRSERGHAWKRTFMEFTTWSIG